MDLTQFGDAAEQWRGQLRGSGVIGSPAGVLFQDQASTPFGESPKHRDRACVHAVQRRREHWGVQVADCPPAWPALLARIFHSWVKIRLDRLFRLYAWAQILSFPETQACMVGSVADRSEILAIFRGF